jgi:hypothetical protein
MKDDNDWYEERRRERKRQGIGNSSLGIEMLRQSDSAFWLVLGGMAVHKAASMTANTIFKKEEVGEKGATLGVTTEAKAEGKAEAKAEVVTVEKDGEEKAAARMAAPDDGDGVTAYSGEEMPPEIAATMSRQKKELAELYEMARKAAVTVKKMTVDKG